MSEKILHLTDANFDDTIKTSRLPVLVDFWAEWCGPCRMVTPILEELATEFDGKALITKVNVDENRETASRFGIQAIPTLIFFKNGDVADRIIGAESKASLSKRLNTLTGEAAK